MRIDFESSGGFANLQLRYSVDTAELPSELARELTDLVRRSGFFSMESPPDSGGIPGLRDVFSYRLAIADGTQQKSITCNDMTALVPLRPLLSRLRKLALEHRRK